MNPGPVYPSKSSIFILIIMKAFLMTLQHKCSLNVTTRCMG